MSEPWQMVGKGSWVELSGDEWQEIPNFEGRKGAGA